MVGPYPTMTQLPEGPEGLSEEDYVRESVTKRIRAFEKQASKEEDPIAERLLPPARPVAPWVKKTSAGPVQHDTYWDMTSPEEQQPGGAPMSPPVQAPGPSPAPPPPPPPVHTPTPVKQVERTMSPSRPAHQKVPSGNRNALARPRTASLLTPRPYNALT